MIISYLNLFNFFFCSCFPSTLALVLQYKARSLRWAALLASTCSISFFVLVSPLPSLLFSTAMQFGINGLQCLPQLIHFLHFPSVSPLPSPKFYTQAIDQKENKPRPRAKARGPRAKAKGPRQKGQEPRQKGQEARQKGKRAKVSPGCWRNYMLRKISKETYIVYVVFASLPRGLYL